MPITGKDLKEIIGDLMVTIHELRRELEAEQEKVRGLSETLDALMKQKGDTEINPAS